MKIFEGTISARSGSVGSMLSGVTLGEGVQNFYDGSMVVDPTSGDGGTAGFQLKAVTSFPLGLVRVEFEQFRTGDVDPTFGTNSVTVRRVSSDETTHRITSADGPWQAFSAGYADEWTSPLKALPGGAALAVEDSISRIRWLSNGTSFLDFDLPAARDAGNFAEVAVVLRFNTAGGTARPMFGGLVRIYAEPYVPPEQRFWEDIVGCKELTQ